ncbi:MAG: hypothetical protein JO269_11590 [Burkholderiaceae bacterium]|nr:hypothetical protein [Burkholderiaceae bacterium]
MSKAVSLATALLLGSQEAAGAPAAQPLMDLPMNQIVQGNVYPQLRYFFEKLGTEKEHIKIDGYSPFESDDKFLPGKIAAGLGDLLLHTPRNDPRFNQVLSEFRDIADLTVHMDNHTWGIYYYVSTLYKLKKAGLLEQAISPQTLMELKKELDWRTFVTQPDFHLINLPTNYYGVAFSIARLRMLLGWEDDSGSKTLMNKMLEHYAAYSGKYGFSDETPGDGRFDRYSILLVAEICERFVETGMDVTPELKAMLRKTVDLALSEANASGEGLSFGRSLGPYGETAMLEILSISAYLDVLTPEEKQYAYTYCSHIAARYVDFWYNPAIKSVDMWKQGRRTDTYRGEHRILGENFSLLHQLVFTNEMWNRAGFENVATKPDLAAWLNKTQPRFKLTWFAQGEYDRAIAVFRDKSKVFSLLMVNGGPSQHDNSPYYPLPFAHNIVSGIADSGYEHAQLLPKFKLADGSELMGAAYIKGIHAEQNGDRYVVGYHQDELDKLGGKAPAKDARIKLETEYTLEAGKLVRVDKYTPAAPLDVAQVSLEFASFSDDAALNGNDIHFGQGEVTDFEVGGLQTCRVEKTLGSATYQSPDGPMKTHVTCTTGPFKMQEPLVIKWVIKYRQP